MTSSQPQYDIIIDPNYHRTFYSARSLNHNRERRFQPSYAYRHTDQRDVHACAGGCQLSLLYWENSMLAIGVTGSMSFSDPVIWALAEGGVALRCERW